MVSIKAWLLKALEYCPDPNITDSTLETELTSILGDISVDRLFPADSLLIGDDLLPNRGRVE